MFKGLIYEAKNNKAWFCILLFGFISLVFDIAVIVFDVVELILTRTNSAKLADAFLGLNIALIVVSVVITAITIVYILFRKK